MCGQWLNVLIAIVALLLYGGLSLGILSIQTTNMLFELKACGDVMWMVVSHADGVRELVSRFTLTIRKEDVYLNVGASCERGYPVVKGNCFISEHDEQGEEMIPQYCVDEEGMMVEDLLCLLIFLKCWVSSACYNWENATWRQRNIQEVYDRFEEDGLNEFVPGWGTVGMHF